MNKTKLISLLAVLAALIFIAYKLNQIPSVDKRPIKIGLVYLVQHPAIEQGINGFKAEIKRIEANSDVVFDVTYSNAFGEPKNVNGIVSKFKDDGCSAIVALTTPCAQISKQLVSDLPIIFVGISDPISAGLVNSLESGLGNVTGTISKDPNFETLQLATELFPSIKRVGVIFSSSEANSISILKNLDSSIVTTGINVQVIKKAVTSTNEILPTTKSLLKDVDALFVINDNLVVSAVDLLIKEAKKRQKLIFASDIESVKKGALFTYGLNYEDEGIASANILKQIVIDGKKPDEIPVFVNSRYYLYVNRDLLDYQVDTSKIGNAKVVGRDSI